MLRKVVQVVVQSLPAELQLSHPLHVGLEDDDFNLFCETRDKQTFAHQKNGVTAALLKENAAISELPENVFVLIYPVKTSSYCKSSSLMPLFVTKNFMSHYTVTTGDLRFLKIVSCFPIEKMIIGSKSVRSYNWFQDVNLHKELILYSCTRNMLCREGDVILSYPLGINANDTSVVFENVTLDCQPFGQGILTIGSTIVVTDMSEISYKPNSNSVPDEGPGQISKKTDIFAYLHLMDYTSNILGIRTSTPSITSTTVKPFIIPMNSLKTMCLNFHIRIIPTLSKDFEDQLSKTSLKFDAQNTIFLTKSALKSLNAIDGSWVKVKLLKLRKSKIRRCSSTPSPSISEDEEKQQRRNSFFLRFPQKWSNFRLASVCCFANEDIVHHYFDSHDIVYMSPHLWFNLNNHPSKLIQSQTRLQIEACDNEFSNPPYVTEAYAALIQSPNYNGSVSCGSLLSHYFQTPRYICKGDIFCINTKDQIDFYLQDCEQDTIKSSVVYFRISSIEGPPSQSGYLLDDKHSRLYEAGTTQSYIPVTMETFYTVDNGHPIWNSPVSKGLSYYVELIQDFVLPFLKMQNTRYQLSSSILFTGAPCCGKTTVVKAVCKSLNLHLYQVNCHELAGESTATTEAKLKIVIDKGSVYAPCIILLKNIHFIGKEKEMNNEDSRVLQTLCRLLKNVNNSGNEWPVIVIGTTTDQKLLSNDIMSAFLYCVQMEPPNEEERSLLLQDLLTVSAVGNDVSTLFLAQRTAGFVLGDLCALVNQAVRNAYNRVRKFVSEKSLSEMEEEDVILSGVPIVQRDLLTALEKLQSDYAEIIGAPKIPNVLFEDVGGLTDVKQEILDTIQLPLEHPEILSSGLRRSGVLLFGPPGTGKTLLAKAVATECSLNFLSVKGPELINMYVGQSEENVRAVFTQARSAVPCIIFFDELDSLAPNRGRSGDSGGVMDRVVSQLLAELDGLNKKTEVFVIGATNRPDLIDPALLRPGRFDRLLYVGIPEEKISKLSILEALTRKFPMAEDVNLEEIIEKCPSHLSGADFYALCSNAVIKRVEKNVELIEMENINVENISDEVHMEDFLCALESLEPSVLPEQLMEYERIKLNV